MSLSWRRFIWRSWKNVFEAWELFWSSLRSLRTFECHCVLLCTTLLRRRVTELSNLCGLAQVRAVKKSCHAALVFSHVSPYWVATNSFVAWFWVATRWLYTTLSVANLCSWLFFLCLAGGSACRLFVGCFCFLFWVLWFAMLCDHLCPCRIYFELLLHM